jgi:hypothetical protein
MSRAEQTRLYSFTQRANVWLHECRTPTWGGEFDLFAQDSSLPLESGINVDTKTHAILAN